MDVIIPASLSINCAVSPTLNFAMQQNDVPVVRQVTVSNPGSEAIGDVQLRIRSEPEFFPPWQCGIATIPPGGAQMVGPCDLRLSLQALMGLTERMMAGIHIEAVQGEQLIGRVTESVEMLAFDEWNGFGRSIPELLAAFVLPNHPVVESMLSEAARHLREATGDAALSGYQQKSPRRVAQTVASIYAVLQSKGIEYCVPPASFEHTGQKIRLPDRIMDARLATCLDLAVLMAACLEQAGLHPLVLFTEGHAFVGVWLVEEHFADCATDNVLRIRKRVDLKEILVLETTLLTHRPPVDLSTAITTAESLLKDESTFVCAVDIFRCRKSRIRPLPLRAGRHTDGSEQQEDDAAPSLPVELLADFDTGPATANEAATARETPTTRLDRWKRKLLDLTLHNRLINFRPTKKTVPLQAPNLAALEDALADGLAFSIRPRLEEFGEHNERDAGLHRLRTGQDALGELVASEFEARRLHAALTDDDLGRRLLEIYRTARTAMEEGGVSALYLALGFVEWFETDQSEQKRRAPIILVPVELDRRSVREGFSFCQGDEEPSVNITLLELLAKDFGVRIPGMDPIPQDDHGIDVKGIFRSFRQAILNQDRWNVVEEAHIGFFSFTKFLLWRDLEKRTEALRRSKVVDHLINRASETYPDDGVFPDAARLDETHPPQETYCPVSSDSSQLAAVYAADAGKSFVLFGPPGTGKSQTITNLIAHCLARGKTVLFVSEKMAALNVVHHRLVQAGLGRHCLEIHSNKASKRHVIEQLGQALEQGAPRPSDDWQREAARLAALRGDLNAYAHALHRPRALGESVFQAAARRIGFGDGDTLDLPLRDAEGIDRARIDHWHELIDRLEVACQSIGAACGHAWSTTGLEAAPVGLSRRIETELDVLESATSALAEVAFKVGQLLSLGSGWNLTVLTWVDQFLRFLLSSPGPSASMILGGNEDDQFTTALVACGKKRDALRTRLFAVYPRTILDVDVDALLATLKSAKLRWLVPRWMATRTARRILRLNDTTPNKRSLDDLIGDLTIACLLRREAAKLEQAAPRATGLLGKGWKGGEADWDYLETARDWCQRLRHFAAQAAGNRPENASIFLKRWSEVLADGRTAVRGTTHLSQLIEEYVNSNKRFREAKKTLEATLGGASCVAWSADPRRTTLDDVIGRVKQWREALPQLRAWCNYRAVRQEAVGAGLGALIKTYEAGSIGHGDLRANFDRSFYRWWLESVTEADPVLSRFFSPEHQRKIEQFRQLDDQLTTLTRREIQARLAARRPIESERVNDASEIGMLRRQLQLRRGHLPVRQLFQRIPHLLRRLKPCLLMSPISVAQYLDVDHAPFDLIVFDEASQIPVWDAVGAIARGAEVVVVGDPKQLPPTNFFSRADEQELQDDDVVEELESILDDCLASGLPQMALRWHYRSRHESLIAFSNRHYYDNRLLTFPSPHTTSAVTLCPVAHGLYDKGKSRTNRAEAEALVADVVRRLTDPASAKPSMGIVTFSIAQQGLIEDLLDQARREHPEIESYFGEEVTEPVFVKNLENVQGDERDLIFFSICYGPDEAGRISMNFGPLNRDGGERRLNVAITRAREAVFVYSTLRAEQIDLSRTRARGVEDLKGFLDYAAKGPVALAQAAVLSDAGEPESPFEQAVLDRLRERGHRVHCQVGCSGYRIDLAIVDPVRPGRYLLGIECDGANYHSAKTARDRDKLREAVLRGLGWNLHRVWSSDWWENPAACLDRIEEAVCRAATDPPPTAPEPPPDLSPANLDSVDTDPNEEPPAEEAVSLPVYKAYGLQRQLGPSAAFYVASSDIAIREKIESVVTAEGPVRLELVAKRVAAHWGINRRGAQVVDRIAGLAGSANLRCVRHADAVFLWPRNEDPDRFEKFRIQGRRAEDQRDIDEIPPEEIAVAALFVLRQQVSLPAPALIRETAMLLGFQRAGSTIQRIVAQAIEQLQLGAKVIDDGNGRLVLATAMPA